MKNTIENILSGGGGPAEPVPYLVPRVCTANKLSLPGVRAFTMAEILLSLTIIGVVAAITLPSLTGNINERTWNTQRKALYARLSQAVALMPSLNGYGTLSEATSSASAVDTVAETFVTNGLSKVLKINNICDYEHFEDCGIGSKFTNLQGSTITSFPKTLVEMHTMFSGSSAGFVDSTPTIYSWHQQDTKAAAFETANGESMVVYYNPICRDKQLQNEENQNLQPYMCANFVYDLNGTKGPNTMGKDMGVMTALYAYDPVVVAPVPLIKSPGSFSREDAAEQCSALDSESRMPNIEESASIAYNKFILGIENVFWSSTLRISKNEGTKGLVVSPGLLKVYWYDRDHAHPVRCIKR